MAIEAKPLEADSMLLLRIAWEVTIFGEKIHVKRERQTHMVGMDDQWMIAIKGKKDPG